MLKKLIARAALILAAAVTASTLCSCSVYIWALPERERAYEETAEDPLAGINVIVCTPTSAPAEDNGMFGDAVSGRFTSQVSKQEKSYVSSGVSVQLIPVIREGLAYYFADIYVKDITSLKTAFSSGEYLGSNRSVLSMAKDNSAVIAMNGDYYSYNSGVVIRNGELYRDKVSRFDQCVIYKDGTMETYSPEEMDVDAVMAAEPWQSWSFGPELLDDAGMPKTEFNSTVTVKNPRAAIGYFEPGHYCFVLVDGRGGSYSRGMTMEELSQLFYELGCKKAFNLDGGQTAVMVFDGAVANRPFRDGRDISDILYIEE